ncbi:MAG: alanine racemase, partial [Burkholderiales bacterium]
MPHPLRATIQTAALRHNLGRLRDAAAGVKLWAVVKANAYGHGIDRVYDALRDADGFALLDIAEAERIRALGWFGPILLLEGAFDAEDLQHCTRLKLWPVVHDTAQIDMLAVHKATRPLRVFLKVNSGMNRLGFAPHKVCAAWHRLDELAQVGDISLSRTSRNQIGKKHPRSCAQLLDVQPIYVLANVLE